MTGAVGPGPPGDAAAKSLPNSNAAAAAVAPIAPTRGGLAPPGLSLPSELELTLGQTAAPGAASRDSATAHAEPGPPEAWRTAPQQLLLGSERQRTLDGGEEPLAAVAPLPAPAPPAANPRQLELELPQAQQPLHLVQHAPSCDGKEHQGCKPHPDCTRSYFATPCPHHPNEKRGRARPCCCARSNCESSYEANTLERRRDAWDGTAGVTPRHGTQWHARARGVRHFGEEIPLGVFVVTLPEELRPLCQGARLKKFRRAAHELALKVLRRHVGNERALFWSRSWFHPEGDEDGHAFKPHENVLVPLAWVDPATGRPHLVGRHALPKSWFGAGGWVADEWRKALRVVFGGQRRRDTNAVCYLAGDFPVDWHYQFKSSTGEKLHALKYFGRVFPWWTRSKGVQGCMRPISRGLSHWKHGDELRRIFNRYVRDYLPPENTCEECLKEGVPLDEIPPRIPIMGAREEHVKERAAAAMAAHSCAACQSPGLERPLEDGPYLEYRRTMAANFGVARAQGPPRATSPPSEWVDAVTGEVLEHGPAAP